MEPFSLFVILASLIGTGISAMSNMSANQANINAANNQLASQQGFSSEEAEKANERALDNYWATMSPQSRVQQFKDAGLSPGLMYSGGFGSGGVNTAPQATAPSANLPNQLPILGQGLNDMFDNVLKASETKKTDAETEGIEATIQKTNAEITEIESKVKCNIASEINTNLQNDMLKIDLDIKTATKEEQIGLVKKQYELISKSVEEAKQRIKAADIELKYKDKLLQAELNNLGAQFYKYVSETYLNIANESLAWAKKQLTLAQKEMTEEQKEYWNRKITEVEQNNRIIKARADRYDSPEFYMMEFGHDSEMGSAIIMSLGTLEETAEMIRERMKNKPHGAGGKF